MKTLELDLKKKILIVQPEETGNMNYWVTLHSKDWDFKCLGSELTEEMASELVDETIMYEKHRVKCYRYRSYREGFVAFDNSIESFISAVESKGFHWLENPAKYERNGSEIYADKNKLSRYISKEEIASFKAEEKTFRNPLIFVKK